MGDLPGTFDNGVIINKSGASVTAVDVDNRTVLEVAPGAHTPKKNDWDFLVDGRHIIKVSDNVVEYTGHGKFTFDDKIPILGEDPRAATRAERRMIQRILGRQGEPRSGRWRGGPPQR